MHLVQSPTRLVSRPQVMAAPLPPYFATGAWSGGQADADGCYRLEPGTTVGKFAALDDAREAARQLGHGAAITSAPDGRYTVVELLLRLTDHPYRDRHEHVTLSLQPISFARGILDLPVREVGDLRAIEFVSGDARVIERNGRLVDG